jgi:phage antirepressor YoqD-like protein
MGKYNTNQKTKNVDTNFFSIQTIKLERRNLKQCLLNASVTLFGFGELNKFIMIGQRRLN